MSYIEKNLVIASLKSGLLSSELSDADIKKITHIINDTIHRKMNDIQRTVDVELLKNKLELLEFYQEIEYQRTQQFKQLQQNYFELSQNYNILKEEFGQFSSKNLEKKESTPKSTVSCVITFVNAIKNENDPSFDHIEKLQGFLLSYGIGIKNIPLYENTDNTLNSIALFMGERYRCIEKIYKKIKSVMQVGGSFQEYIGNMSQNDISSVCQWCNLLFKIAFLEQYLYQKSPKYIIRVKTTTLPIAQNFISGHWLERYTSEKINQILHEISLTYKIKINATYLMNPQIVLPNGDQFELDILYEINDKFYWIEAKTGNYQQYIQKYSKVAKMLNLDQKHAIMILTEPIGMNTQTLCHLFNMNVVSIDNFVETFKNILIEDLVCSEDN